MESNHLRQSTTPLGQSTTARRGFLGRMLAGAAALGMAGLVSPLSLAAKAGIREETTGPGMTRAGVTDLGMTRTGTTGPDEWFDKIRGKHRMIFDATGPKDILTFAWPKIFLMTNAGTGTAEKDCSAVIVLRHEAIPYAMEDSLWAKYKFGEVFKIPDPATKAPSLRNPFWKPKPGDFKVPGVGNVAIGINELQDSGVLLCACDVALTVYSAALGGGMNLDPQEVKKEWLSGILPGVQVVPSGVWAVGRAQEHGCGYCYAG